MTTRKKNLLQNTTLFATVPQAVLAQLVEALEVVRLKAGETLFEKGDVGKAMYVISEGRVRVHDGRWTLNYLSTGGVFGEIAALDSEIRSASITAEVDSTLFRLAQETLYNLMLDRAEVTKGIIHGLCQHLRDRSDDLVEDYRYREVLEKELEIGRDIQASFLPDTLPQEPGWEIAAFFQAAREVAGDFYDAFALSKEHRIGLVIGDVCDKGVGAALFMTLFRSLIRALAYSDDVMRHMNISPAQLDDRTRLKNSVLITNNYIANTHGQTSMFATLFFGLLDPATGVLTYINAGHETPIVLGPNGVKKQLKPTAPAVGLFPDIPIDVQETRLEPGEILLAFTDGVPDAINQNDEAFTKERLISLLDQTSLTAQGLVNHIVDTLTHHIGDASQFDDITLLAMGKRSKSDAKTP